MKAHIERTGLTIYATAWSKYIIRDEDQRCLAVVNLASGGRLDHMAHGRKLTGAALEVDGRIVADGEIMAGSKLAFRATNGVVTTSPVTKIRPATLEEADRFGDPFMICFEERPAAPRQFRVVLLEVVSGGRIMTKKAHPDQPSSHFASLKEADGRRMICTTAGCEIGTLEGDSAYNPEHRCRQYYTTSRRVAMALLRMVELSDDPGGI